MELKFSWLHTEFSTLLSGIDPNLLFRTDLGVKRKDFMRNFQVKTESLDDKRVLKMKDSQTFVCFMDRSR